jgi:diguanylate cyclase (GGDEF)-like protein
VIGDEKRPWRAQREQNAVRIKPRSLGTKAVFSREPGLPWGRARYFWPGIVAVVVGMLISVAAGSAVWQRENELAQLELSSRANGHALNLQFGINSYLRKVSGLRAFFDTTNNVSRAQFLKITAQLMNDQNAILGMSWIPHVTRDQRAAYERAATLDGIPDYHIKAVAADGSLAPSPEKDEYFPIFYTATEAPGSRVYGLDLNDGGLRQRTLERARDSDAIATSQNIPLQSGTGNRSGFFVALPVYLPGQPHETLADRRRNLLGFVQAVFQTDVMIETLLRTTTTPAGLDLYFYSTDYRPDPSVPVYFHGSRTRADPIEPLSRAAVVAGPHWSGTLDIGDARWTMIAIPTPGGPGIPAHARAWLVLIGGLVITLILAGYFWATGRHTERLEIANRQLDAANDELSAQNLKVDAALNNMVQGFIMFDGQERIVVCNDRYIEMYGLSREIVKPGCSLRELFQHRAAVGHLKIDPDRYRDDLLAELAKGEVVNWVVATADGREISVTNKPMIGGGWVVTHEDITERRRAEAKISHMALHDGLTDLANRYLLDEQVANRFEQLGRGQKFAVLCLDLDNFKNVNDTLGHPFGDKILKEVGTRLRGCVRESDTVARIGGDEFAILQRDVTDSTEADSLSERIIEVIGMPFDLEGSQVVIGVSIGIAIAPTDATDGVELLKAADLALFRAKSDGRGTYRFFEYTMDGRAEARRALERDLRKALMLDEFVLHYQPIIKLHSGQTSSFETLIRWNHPEHGLIPPAEFIPFAEETGLIVPIGEWVLRQACAEAVKWPSDVGVAVNLSPVQFRRHDLCQTVADALATSGLAAHRLALEITESVLLRNQETTLETLRQLRALGVVMVMDDFGTGHSSLSYLRNFPFDKIKIDRVFVHNLSSKKDSRAIIRAIAQLASSLGMDTTGEGVETKGELDFLKRVGCTEAQGHFFSKAVPAHAVHALLARPGVRWTGVA